VWAYLSLGSNLGDRAAQLAEAIRRLGAAGLPPTRVSHAYETEPQGRRDQPWFLNCVVGVETERGAREILATALAIEAEMGRRRLEPWGPRVIDIDLLLYGRERIAEPDLTVPHPRLAERAFALVPLVEIAPRLRIPGLGPAAPLARARLAEGGQTVRLWGPVPGFPPTAGGKDGRGPIRAQGAPGGRSTRERLLARLRAAGGQPVSGAELAAELGVTRSAVWKQVRRLRAEGFAVAGTPGSGYRLAEDASDPDPWSTSELVSDGRREVGRVLHVLRTVDSTNRLARQLGLAGTPSGTAVVAERQTAGRGRHGRTFLSPPGGVYLSVVLRPALPPPQTGRLTLLGAVAACEAIERVAGLAPAIKWPNDVLLPGGKVCGVLLEMVGREDCVDFVVLGIGVNVRHAPEGVGAACLWDAGARVGRAQVARALLDRLDADFAALREGRWPELLAEWRRRCITLGRPVRVECLGGEVFVGRAVDVTLEGALLVEAPDGVRTVYAGDVTHLRPDAEAGTAAPGPGA
jgi:BirA family biotin operon repressor/biotin-[acetyl-CoA-carboxylase] ligase